MKFEFVEFYPAVPPKKNKNFMGTLHIYLIDVELDIRGISVIRHGKNLFFNFPHFWAIDVETEQEARYPVVRFASDPRQQAMIDFLQKDCKPIILERLKTEMGKSN
jgi:hypothetical protein